MCFSTVGSIRLFVIVYKQVSSVHVSLRSRCSPFCHTISTLPWISWIPLNKAFHNPTRQTLRSPALSHLSTDLFLHQLISTHWAKLTVVLLCRDLSHNDHQWPKQALWELSALVPSLQFPDLKIGLGWKIQKFSFNIHNTKRFLWFNNGHGLEVASCDGVFATFTVDHRRRTMCIGTVLR